MTEPWFPRPALERDVVLLQPSGAWTAGRVLALLHDPRAREWRDKVGVAGPRDGSAKPTTRLLAVDGVVFKTRTDLAFDDEQTGVTVTQTIRERGRHAAVWHPGKVWAVIRCEGRWYSTSICPELRTIRHAGTWPERAYAWLQMVQSGVDAFRLHGLGLDLNPSNFAREERGPRLYYLDDEFYDDLRERNLASALVARIPEETAADETAWLELGRAVGEHLQLASFSWEHFLDEVLSYPLPERFRDSQDALYRGICLGRGRRVTRRASPAPLTCVLADVHGNLAALEAVVNESRALGVNAYLFLGDAVGYGPNPAECVRLLAELPRLTRVRGNHDQAIASGNITQGMNSLARQCAAWTRAQLGPAELAWLEALPDEHVEPTFMAVHGAPRDPRKFYAYVYEMTYEDNLRHLRDIGRHLCFCGHTHVQETYAELSGGPTRLGGCRTIEIDPRRYWIVNPGSVGQPRDGDPRASFAIWNRRTNELTAAKVPYDIERTVRELGAAGLEPRLAQRLLAGT